MVTSEQSRRSRGHPGDLVDRIVQLKRALSGTTAAGSPLRRELARLKQAEQLLGRELKAAVHHRR